MSSTTRLAITRDDYETVAALMTEYVSALPFELDFQDFAAERTAIAGVYGGESGAAFLVESGTVPVGVCGVSRFEEGIAELKRMYLRPDARGRGLGRHLATHALAAARRLGYDRVRLDTVAALETASALYRSLGFVEIGPYRHNPQPDARFFEFDLANWPEVPMVGAILTGGSGTRMGADKADLMLGDRSLASHVEDALRLAGLATERVGRAADAPGMAGPLAGLVGTMRTHPGADVFLAATDQPYLRPETINGIASISGDIVIPLDERPQTTCALYRDAVLPMLERYASSNPEGSLQDVANAVATARLVNRDTWSAWGEDGRSWLSLDTPAEWEAAEASWPDPPGSTMSP